MSGNELYEDEDPKPGSRPQDGAARRVSRVSANESGSGSKTGSRPTTSSSPRLAASQSRPTSSRPTTGRAAKPAPAPEPEPIDRPNTSTRAAVLLDDFDKKGGKDNTMLWVYSATGLLVVAGIIVVIMAVGKEGKKKQAFEDREAAVAGVMSRLRDAVATKPDNFDINIQLADDALKVILDPAGMVVKEYPKERAEAEGIKIDMLQRKEKKKADDDNNALLAKTEAEINDFSKIQELERQMKQLELIGNGMGKEYAGRVKKARRTLTINRLKAAGQKAEDEAQKAAGDFEAACRAFDEPMRTFRDFFKLYQPPIDPATGKAVTPDLAVEEYRKLLAKSDDWVNKLVTPEFMDKTTPRDMMSVVERKSWGGSKDGITAEWTGRELMLTHKPMADGKKVMGVYSLDGWTVEWWDYAFEFEFEIIEGGFEVLLRYRPDGYIYYTTSFKAGEAGYEKGQTYRLKIGLVGSKVTVEQQDQASSADAVKATVSRTGGIGLALGTGAKVAIKSFQLKVFRPRGGK